MVLLHKYALFDMEVFSRRMIGDRFHGNLEIFLVSTAEVEYPPATVNWPG